MSKRIEAVDLDLDRDLFLRKFVRELSGSLEDVIGVEAAEGYISTVGSSVGRWIDDSYKEAMGTRRLSAEEVGEVCIDLKKRIGGDFYLISASRDELVFGNRRCPFGAAVKDRPSLCMMTSNVFGRITADNLGYARVELQETIAQGDPGCRVVVRLTQTPGNAVSEREYYRAFDPDLAEGP
ncbi:methanogen output domain 1-containing protein [Marinovum sp.]|uniref:methanogen output domain 1-containing protein n=1 Tax=Marinovum sp. TaxID=2024839 RepID=UPI002B276DFD|nr:methanogen output domain 1-containing protein [Marinovum sp.]